MNSSTEEALFQLAQEKRGAPVGRFRRVEAASSDSRCLSNPGPTNQPLLLERRLGQAPGKVAGTMNQAFDEQRRRLTPIKIKCRWKGGWMR